VTVQKAGTSPVLREATVTAVLSGSNRTLVKDIFVGTKFLDYMEGPSSTTVGTTVYFYAYPSLSSSYGTYDWIITPATGYTIVSASGNMLAVSFSQPTIYTIRVRLISPCTTAQSFSFIQDISVSQFSPFLAKNKYTVSTDGAKQVVAKLSDADKLQSNSSQAVNYTLFHSISGISVASGDMPVAGKTLDFGNIATGVYFLKIETDADKIETHKIFLK
jgi:hypothetical protein